MIGLRCLPCESARRQRPHGNPWPFPEAAFVRELPLRTRTGSSLRTKDKSIKIYPNFII